MAQSTPVTNMVIIANASDLTCSIVAAMMTNETVRDLFVRPEARENVCRGVVMAINKQLDGYIRDLPTGQFNKSVLEGAHQARGMYPNVKA